MTNPRKNCDELCFFSLHRNVRLLYCPIIGLWVWQQQFLLTIDTFKTYSCCLVCESLKLYFSFPVMSRVVWIHCLVWCVVMSIWVNHCAFCRIVLKVLFILCIYIYIYMCVRVCVCVCWIFKDAHWPENVEHLQTFPSASIGCSIIWFTIHTRSIFCFKSPHGISMLVHSLPMKIRKKGCMVVLWWLY